MLEYLQIKNFTIIENESVELHPGLNIITGESGTGKSLILDAIYLLLGSRTNTETIRPGSEQCELTSQFNIRENIEAKAWLSNRDIESDECIITRKFHKEKSNKCYVNGQMLTQKQLKEFAKQLVYIHSQNENYKICDPMYQLELLDGYTGVNTLDIAASYHKLDAINAEIADLTQVVETQHDRLAMLEYYLEELYENTQDQEPFETLEHNYKRLNENMRYQEILAETEDFIAGDTRSNLSALSSLLQRFTAYQKTFPETNNIINLLQDAITNLTELQQEIKLNISDNNDYDEGELENKINKYHDLARKHNTKPNNLHNIIAELERKKADILASKDNLEAKKAEQEVELAKYNSFATKLHKQRQEAATRLSEEIKNMLPSLGMPHGKITINVTHREDLQKVNGRDEICFMFSANLGHELEKIQNIASGGEIARVSMILELLTNNKPKTTFIFDEIDTGVSGKIARDIGKVLKQLSTNSQVIAITHSPQIASLADHNYKITKVTENKQTFSKISHLSNEEKINEIATLISDGSLNDNAVKQAKILCDAEV